MSTLAAQALQQALIAASRDQDERWRAVSALRGAEVYAATWPADPMQLRTLMSSAGVRALALFTDERHLEEAALRLAWHGVDGHVPMRRLHMSEAIRFARDERVSLVIIDMASEYALELDQGDMELIAAPPSTRPPYGGMAAVVSSPRSPDDGSEVQRVSTRPPPPPVLSERGERGERESQPPSALRPSAINVDVAHQAVSATFAPSSTASMAALEERPSEELVEALVGLLRDYCEVEWACFVADANRPAGQQLSVALRIDGLYRRQLPQIGERTRAVSAAAGAPCQVLVLETLDQMKRARQIGLPFYPWRRRW